LSGGALALDGTFIIELARLDHILDIDAINRTVRVETGVLNAEVSRRARPYGLYYSPDPSSQKACTIGGNIAENAGGIHCLRNGVTVDHVAEIMVVLSDGEIVELHDASIRPGFDLAGVFVGSEGTFGIATEATLRLLPVAPSVRTVLAAFKTIHDGSKAVSDIIASGILPAALEMMDAVAIRAVEAGVHKAGLPLDASAALIIEIEGIEASVSVESAMVESICLRSGAISVEATDDPRKRERIWKARKGAFGAMGRLSPDVMIQDAVVPRSRLPEVLDGIQSIASKYELTVANVFHAGDGNLHPLIPFDSSDPAAVERVKSAGQEMMRVCIDVGGAITGEHGVGIDKIDYLGLSYSAEDLDAMLQVRAAFDPLGLCNPGKAIPVLRGCGEARAVASKKTSLDHDPETVFAQTSAPRTPPQAPLTSTGLTFDPENAIQKLSALIGSENVRVHGESLIAQAASYDEISECLKLSGSENWTVTPMGAGNWMDAGEAWPLANVLVSTRRLSRLVRHEPADLVATVQSGMLLGDLNAALGSQWLPLDPPFGSASTLGGVIATGMAGPLSLAFGRPRNRVLGIKAALADGTVIKAGGSVVKNVAGYDLGKLLTGSFGTLAVVLEVSLKLCAMPEADRTLVLCGSNPITLIERAFELRANGVHPSAAAVVSTELLTGEQLLQSAYVLLLRFMGLKEAVDAEIDKTRHLLAVAEESKGDARWGDLSSAQDQVMWRVSTPPSQIGALAAMIRQSRNAPRSHIDPFQGWIRCFAAEESTDPDELSKMRAFAAAAGGSMVIDRAPDPLKENVGAWGDLGSARTIMARIKSRLDPSNRLSPNRFDLTK
jgi:glycolate oxidase subunit GlcD